MLAVENNHPAPEVLPAFALGLVDHATATEIERHLAECDVCCRVLQEVPDDDLVSRLRDAAAVADQPPADMIDHPRYRVDKLLGTGGMGTVYRAWHRVMERPVALKIISPQLIEKPAAVERFAREVKAAARLSHPNIVTAFDAEQVGRTHILVMEYVEGTDLARLVAERGPLPVAEACDYVHQAALGLQHAYEQGMVHRDIKPHNLMLTRGKSAPPTTISAGGSDTLVGPGIIKILDFGLARFASEAHPDTSATGSGVLLGSVDYIAPEQADNPRSADIRADVYSLGCTLYFLLTGHPPFPEGTAMRKLISHAKRSPRPIEQIPPGLSRILDRMMAKDPECRYQTPAEVAGALRPYLPGMPPPRRKPRRGIASLLGFAAAALLLFGIVTYRIKTDRGELIIEAQDDAVEVVVSKGGRVVKILDTKTDKQITLDSGDYDLKLKDDADGLKLSLDKVTLKRGERVLATIWREAKVAAKPPETNWNVKGEPVITTIPATWTTADDPEVRQLAGPQITRLLFSPDGKRALGAARDDNRVMVWDVETGRKLPPLVMPRSGLYSLAISRNGRRIVTGGVDGVQIWDAETGKEIASFKQGTGTAVTFSPDGKLILAGILDDAQRLGSIRVLEVETGKLLRVIDGDAIVVSLAISPDGKRALAFEGGQQVVKLLELETGKLVRAFGGDGMNKRTFATFSPDGRRGLTFSTQGAQVWDIESGKELLKIAAQAAVFTPDGRHLLTARSDGIYVTQIVRPEATVVVKKMDLKSATLIALSSDGQRVLTANASGVVQLYTLPGLVQLHTLPDQSIQK